MNKTPKKGNLNIQFGAFLGLVFIIFIIFVIILISFQKILRLNTTNVMHYYTQSNLSFEVCLKDNAFFEEECLSHDREYITMIIDNININFDYIFSASNKFDYKYSYEIITELVATEKLKSKKKIFERIENVIDKKEITMDDSSNYVIREKVSINYDKYNDVMKELKKEYAIMFDAKLVVKLNVYTEGKKDNIKTELKNFDSIVFEIPLSEQTINLASGYNNLRKEHILDDSQVNEEEKKNLIRTITLLFGVEVILISLAYIMLRKRMYKKNKFKIEVTKIMKEYDRYITTIETFPNLGDKSIINVSSFKELLDAREWLNKPILYSEANNKGWFLIIADPDVYMYTLEK